MTKVTARELALKVLKAVEEEGAYANLALNKILEKYQPGKLDRAFTTELTYGTLRTLNTLDWVISRFLKQPLASQTVWVRNILRLGTYQLLFLEKIPPAAACNEAVELAKKYAHGGVVKFVNGVLRNITRNLDQIEYPDINSDPVGHVSLKYSHPSWLVERWLKEYGIKETIALCKANNLTPPNTIRTNTLRLSRDELIEKLHQEGVKTEKTRYAVEGLNIKDFLSFRSLKSFQEGLFQVQDESSMLVGHALNPAHGSRVIDAAAAPGGKTTHLAQLMENTGVIMAFDLHEHKINLINDNCRRLGITNVKGKAKDAREIAAEFENWADYVLLDAPCSGLGVLRRRADVRWRKEAYQISAIVKLQREMLESVCRCVRPGGVLLYSTCTITKEENINQIRSFLAKHSEFRLEDLTPLLPAALSGEPGVRQGYIQLLPHVHGMDGFFMARMRKRGI
ncbi:16S rRNA (cytosine967-C5)-methyltransferase [Desulfohalotomaculum tongense]|uniref:16S rRNA (cytosine(967)-C(5))-methyltransferase RsmB n=1 Tax=Desulforadius tongensis TaxID=1216062 RepID=UPI001959B371|nr:16S rRNA (cytosine(967)-C(5))-methyltransferase RsmB [Desulforadius tongensis]MBM7855742.1 16S rRNA (cytosine967-C5)-methyltransferase [Desulforadius tongensis]